ncbi:linear primary-alkylsulfatase-like isoform X2 [Hylaeus volcanicus]|uniref:linear primary-alkylsulfatase-like isoform X2 n=1 Tax=Hylaeus volcanicus TaxID=313075 RepID=UPI0023B796A3|nr:linear primary-alkylsulfatase-like isoform X2 [Hylaeus volcanicus]
MLLFNSYNWKKNSFKLSPIQFHHSKKIYWRVWFFSFLFFSTIFIWYSNLSSKVWGKFNERNNSDSIEYKTKALSIPYLDVFMSQRLPENLSLPEWLYEHSFIYFYGARTVLNPCFLLVTDLNNYLSTIASQLRLIPFLKELLPFPTIQRKCALAESSIQPFQNKITLSKMSNPIRDVFRQWAPRRLFLVGKINWIMLSNNLTVKKREIFSEAYFFFLKKVQHLNFFFFNTEKLLTKIVNKCTAKETSFRQFVHEVNRFASSKFVDLQLKNSSSTRALKKHSLEFRKRIERITYNIFVGVGYGLANTIVIVGKQGLIIIDTLESPAAMKEYIRDLQFFLKIPDDEKPNILYTDIFHPIESDKFSKLSSLDYNISCVIYTHFHSDHVLGTSAIIIPGETPVWAHEKTLEEINRVFGLVGGATYKRAMYQFGSFLNNKDGYVNAGIGERLRYSAVPLKSQAFSLIKPSHIWNGIKKTLTIDGIRLELFLAPGESPDQTIIWIPSQRVLVGADNLYKAFPNIYAIRGTQSRDAMKWVKSLDRMRFFNATYLLLGHTSPMKGEHFIFSTLTAYRDAIQYIHDQTVRYMNKGYAVNSIVEKVHLPQHLRDHPYLQEFYGTVPWAVRAVFQHYIGWFSGRAVDLHPLSSLERAKSMADMVGGKKELLFNSFKAIQNQNYQWGLELSVHAQTLDATCLISSQLKILALKGLASQELSAPGRNWYLTEAKIEREHIDLRLQNKTLLSSFTLFPTNKQSIRDQLRLSTAQKKQFIDSMTNVDDIFKQFSVRTKDELLVRQDLVIGFHFTDIQMSTCWHVRRGIVYPYHKCERKTNFDVTTTDLTWRRILKGEIRPITAIVTGCFRISSKRAKDYWIFKQVMDAIETTLE